MDTIFIRDLKCAAVIGTNEWEQKTEQTLSISLDLSVSIAKAAQSDDLSDALDYQAVSRRVAAIAAEKPIQLLETLAENIAQTLVKEFAIEKVRLTINKGRAVQNAEQVGLVIERSAQKT